MSSHGGRNVFIQNVVNDITDALGGRMSRPKARANSRKALRGKSFPFGAKFVLKLETRRLWKWRKSSGESSSSLPIRENGRAFESTGPEQTLFRLELHTDFFTSPNDLERSRFLLRMPLKLRIAELSMLIDACIFHLLFSSATVRAKLATTLQPMLSDSFVCS